MNLSYFENESRKDIPLDRILFPAFRYWESGCRCSGYNGRNNIAETVSRIYTLHARNVARITGPRASLRDRFLLEKERGRNPFCVLRYCIAHRFASWFFDFRFSSDPRNWRQIIQLLPDKAITWCILKINFESYHDSSKERSYFNRSRLIRKIEKSLNKLLISRATKMQFLKIKIRRRKCRSNDNSSDVQFLRYTNTHTREHTFEKGKIFPVLGRYESTFPIRIEKHGHEEGRHK